MGKIRKLRLVVAAALSVAAVPLAIAAPPASLTPPSAPNICTKAALPAGFVAAARESARTLPDFPDGDDLSEGWVRLGFTINAEGETADIVVLDRIGPETMARAARRAVARWKYKPATQDGEPIEQYGNAVDLVFRRQNVGNTAVHDEAVAKFDEARGLVSAGKYAEGIALLEQTLRMRLTLYEQAKISFALAFAYEKSHDTARALVHVRHTLIEGGTFLEKQVVPAARRMRLRLEAANGNLIHAACAAPLPATDSFDPTGADIKATAETITDAKKRLGATAPLSLDGTLLADPASEGSGVWEHTLTRSKFKFASLGSGVSQYRINCTRQTMTEQTSEALQADVPKAAGPCTLRVYGEIGASFKLVEEW